MTISILQKSFAILFLFVLVFATKSIGQIKKTMPAQRQLSSNLPKQVQVMNSNIIPKRGLIQRMKLVNNFTMNNSAASRSSNVFRSSLALSQRVASNTSKNNFDLTSGGGYQAQSLTNNSRTNMRQMPMNSQALPSITKNVNGTKVTYLLVSPQQASQWSENAQLNPKKNSQSPDSYDANKQMNCHTVSLSFNCQSKSFMNAQPELQGSMLMPGMIFTYEDISNGNFTHQNLNFNRYPIHLYVDAASAGQTSVDVSNPNAASINDGVQTLRKNFGGNPGGGDIMYQITKTESTAEQMLAVTAGGSYGAFSGQATFNHNDSKYHINYTVDAIKELFTVNVMPDSLSFYPASYNLPSNGGFPVMVGNVTYGARVLANLDIAFESSSNTAGLDFQYNSIGASAFANIKAAIANKQATATINGYLVGFPSKFGGTFNTSLDNFENTLNYFFSGCDYVSAKPVQYTLTNLEGDEMGISSITDKTTIQECTPAGQNFKLQSAYVTFNTGDDDKNDNSEFWLSLGSGNENNPHWAAQIYDNHSKFNKGGNAWSLSFPKVAPISFDEFEKGGVLAFKLIAHGHSDDWDFSSLTLTLNFVSDHGLTKQKTLSLNGFRISDTDSNHDSKDVLFQSVGDDKYASY